MHHADDCPKNWLNRIAARTGSIGRLILTLPLIVSLLACNTVQNTSRPVVKNAAAVLLDRSGQRIGQLQLQQGSRGVLVKIEAENLGPPGFHGIHFHERGNCQDHRVFKISGGHIDRSKTPHGLLNSEGGPHGGDLPNLYVHSDGAAKAEFYTELIALGSQTALPALVDADGSALVIHERPDDHRSQPIGGAGPRIACGVILESSGSR